MLKKHQEIGPEDIKPGRIYYYYHSIDKNDNDLWSITSNRCLDGVYCFDTNVYLRPDIWSWYLGIGGPQSKEPNRNPNYVRLPDGSYYNHSQNYRVIPGLIDGRIGALRESIINGSAYYDSVNTHVMRKKRIFKIKTFPTRFFNSQELACQTLLEEYRSYLEEFNRTTCLLENFKYKEPEDEWSGHWCKDVEKYEGPISDYYEDSVIKKFDGFKAWIVDLGDDFDKCCESVRISDAIQLPVLHEVMVDHGKFVGKNYLDRKCTYNICYGRTYLFASAKIAYNYMMKRWKDMLTSRKSVLRRAEFKLEALEGRCLRPRPKFFDLYP